MPVWSGDQTLVEGLNESSEVLKKWVERAKYMHLFLSLSQVLYICYTIVVSRLMRDVIQLQAYYLLFVETLESLLALFLHSSLYSQVLMSVSLQTDLGRLQPF